MQKRSCGICKNIFLPTYSHHTKYCSDKCRIEARDHQLEKTQPYKKRFQVLERDGFRCQYCGLSPRTNKKIVLHVDHINPKDNGGDDDLDNLVTACNYCNIGKGHTFYPNVFPKN